MSNKNEVRRTYLSRELYNVLFARFLFFFSLLWQPRWRDITNLNASYGTNAMNYRNEL